MTTHINLLPLLGIVIQQCGNKHMLPLWRLLLCDPLFTKYTHKCTHCAGHVVLLVVPTWFKHHSVCKTSPLHAAFIFNVISIFGGSKWAPWWLNNWQSYTGTLPGFISRVFGPLHLSLERQKHFVILPSLVMFSKTLLTWKYVTHWIWPHTQDQKVWGLIPLFSDM